jgi:hypothetical protein
MNIGLLLELTESGIGCLINETDKKVYIFYSECLLDALVRNVRQLKDNTHKNKDLVADINKLRYFTIETTTSKDLKIRYNYWVEKYDKLGYSMYRNYIPIRLYAKMAYSRDLKSIEVRIYNKRYEWFVVGVFTTAKEADEWMTQTYPEGRVTEIIYKK